MPHRNRVTPFAEVIETPARGLLYGNRGVLHDDEGRIVRNWQVKRWIACVLEFKGRRRPLLRPGRFTELFFLDEATAFAAGHRPCAECRRASYNAYQTAWAEGLGTEVPRAGAINKRLHAERIVPGTHRRRLHEGAWPDLPDGAFVRLDTGRPAVVAGAHLAEWTTEGYRDRHRRPQHGTAQLITPPATVAALRAGYLVQIDDGAR